MEPITSEELKSIAVSLSSCTSQEELFAANKRKREILSNPSQNLSILMGILANEILEPIPLFFAIDLVSLFMSKYFSCLPIDQIITFLLGLSSEQMSTDAAVNKTSSVVAENIKNMFCFTEENWMIPIPEDIHSVTPLDIRTFQYLLDAILGEWRGVPQHMQRAKICFFASHFITPILKLSSDLFMNNIFINYTVDLLMALLKFMSDSRCEACLGESFALLTEIMMNPIFFGKIMELEKKLSIELLASISSTIKQKNSEIMQHVIECISLIQSSPDNFPDEHIAQEYGKLLMSLDMSVCTELIPSFVPNVMIVVMSFLENDISKFFAIFEGCATFLYCISKIVDNSENIMELLSRIINLPTGMLESTGEYKKEIKDGFSLLCLIVDDHVPDLINSINERLQANYVIPMSHENDISISFCLLLLESVLSLYEAIKNDDAMPHCIQVIFGFIIQSNANIGDIVTNIGDSLVFEEQLISLEKELIVDFYQRSEIEYYKGKLEIPPEIVAKEVFNRLLVDVFHGASLHDAKQAIEEFMQIQKAFQYVCSTDFPDFFMDKYKEIPIHKIVFKVLIQLVLKCPKKQEFLARISEEFRGEVNQEKLIYLLRMMSGFFDGSLTLSDWNELYKFSTANFTSLFDEVSKSDNCDDLLHYFFILMKNFPKSNPFSKHRSNEFDLIRSTASYLVNITNYFAEKAAPIEVDESIFSGPVSLTTLESRENEKQYIVHESNENDDNWEKLERICKTVIYLLKSPCTNIGIMKYYDDKSFLNLWVAISTFAQKTSLVSLQAFPSLVSRMAEYLSRIIVHYSDELMSEEFAPFLLAFVKTIFLSSSSIDIDYACFILQLLTKYGYENIRPHFILALNYARNTQAASQYLLTFLFLVIDNDREFFNSIIDTIVGDAGEYGERVGEVLRILTAEESYETRFSVFSANLADFPIIIDALPSLAEFFVFS